MKTTIKNSNSSIVYYMTEGFQSSKETILFVHPAFADHRSFDDQLDYFSNDFNVITMDLIGHGQSQGFKTSDRIDATSRHINEILLENNFDKVHLVGVSVGGLLIQDFQNKYPEKVKSIVALGAYDINNYDPSFEKKQRKQQMTFMLQALFSMKTFSRSNAKVSTYTKQAEDRFFEMDLLFKRSSFKYMTSLIKIMNQTTLTHSHPLLILCGEYDNELAIKMSKLWYQSHPDAHYKIIAKAGHCANMDNPETFNKVLMDFYQNIEV